MDFQLYKRECFDGIGEKFLGSLATHDDKNVTVRTMSFVTVNECFYFQTDNNSTKIIQIKTNCSCAVCVDRFQILGKCRILGHPLLDQNREVYSVYQEAFPKVAEKYSKLSQEVLVKIEPSQIKVWEYGEQGAQINILDFEIEKCICEKMGY